MSLDSNSPNVDEPRSRISWRKPSWQGVLIVLLTVLVYLPAMGGGFVWDDSFYLTDNPLMRTSDGLYRLWFTADFCDYYPLSTSSLWLEWHLWGMNAAGYHTVNILLHALCAVLLWRVLLWLQIPGAWLAGVIFAVHPVNVESVAWISERKNVLSMLFCLLTILLFLKSESEPGKNWYWLSVLTFLLALLSKITVVMLPIVLLGCAWWQRQRIDRRDWLRSLPFFALSAAVGLVAVTWLQFGSFVQTPKSQASSLLAHIAGAGLAVWFYLGKAVVPINLAIAYPHWNFDPHRFIFHLPTIILVVGFILCWRYRRGWGRPWLFGIGYFVVSLLPAMLNSYPGQSVYSPVADHWQHLAIIGVIALVVGAVATAFERWQDMRPPWGVIGGVVVVGVLSWLTWQQAGVFHNEETLSRNLLAKNPNSWAGHYNLAIVMANRGQTSEAIAEYTEALRVQPDDAETEQPMQCAAVHNNLALVLAGHGQIDDALAHIQEAIRIQPDFAPAYYNLGLVQEKLGKLNEARAGYSKALRFRPDYAEAHYNLGLLLQRQGNVKEAMEHYTQAVIAKPDFAKAHINRGVLFAAQGKVEEAIQCYREALRVNPDMAEAHNNLGVILASQGQINEAARHFAEAVRINPIHADAYYNLGMTLANQGDIQGAIDKYREALRLKPHWVDALNSLAWILATNGNAKLRDGKAAVVLAEEACQRTGYGQPATLDTLAAAYAETGRFEDAIRIAQRAVDLALSMNQNELARPISERLGKYKAVQSAGLSSSPK
jgi:tetratricopeptide (TPR) repeat protein